MGINGPIRILIILMAAALWMGAVATAGEPGASEEGQTPPVESAPPDAGDDPATEEGGEAPEEEEAEEPAEE